MSLIESPIEDALIGILLRHPDRIDSASMLREMNFSNPDNQQVFRVMLSAVTSRSAASWDETLLARQIASKAGKSEAEMISIKERLQNLSISSPPPSLIADYVEQVLEAHRVRILQRGLAEAVSGSKSSDDIFRLANDAIKAASIESSGRMVETVEHYVEHLLAKLKAQREGSDEYRIKTHLSQIDSRIMGLEGGDVLVLAGRPGTGKTAMAMTILLENAKRQIPGEIVSLEMGGISLTQRLLCGVAEIDSRKMRSPSLLTDAEYERLQRAAVEELAALPIHISEKPNQTTLDIAAHARECVRTKGVRLLVIDYLQLITPTSTRKNENRATEVSEMSRHIKLLARELNIPIILLSQMNREGDSTNERPTLKSLRESGAIEQDADFVTFLWRRADQAPGDGIVEAITEKARHVEPGTDLIRAVFKYFRFEDVPTHEREDYERLGRVRAKVASTKMSGML